MKCENLHGSCKWMLNNRVSLTKTQQMFCIGSNIVSVTGFNEKTVYMNTKVMEAKNKQIYIFFEKKLTKCMPLKDWKSTFESH